MQRFTISIDDELARHFDRLIMGRGYANRSEAFRDIVRDILKREVEKVNPLMRAVGVISYVFNHHERQLSSRLADHQHEHTSIIVSTMHVHLNHDDCVETVVVRGTIKDIQSVAEQIITAPGVRHGQLNVIPADEDDEDPGHPHEHFHGHDHEHPHAEEEEPDEEPFLDASRAPEDDGRWHLRVPAHERLRKKR